MPSKKNLGRFPTIIGDYNEATHGIIDPEIRELFLDTYGKDLYYYSHAGEYVSIISLIRAGLVDTWLPPCVSLDVIKATYPDPDLSTVCAATDTGIIYEYIGDGNWIPVSINALKIASEDNDGLISIELFNAIKEYMSGIKEIYIEKNQPVPIPPRRKKNYYYNIFKGMSPSLAEIEWVVLNPVDSIPGSIRDDWPYDQLFLIVKDQTDPDNGKIFEIIDPLYHIVTSQTQIKEEAIPDGYNALYYLIEPNVMVEVVELTKYIAGAYPDDWPYDNGFYLDSDNNRYRIIDPGYIMVRDSTEVVEVEPKCGVTDVFYDVLMDTKGIQIETVIPTPNKESAYPNGWPYNNGFYTNSSGELMKIINPGYIEVQNPDDVKKVDPQFEVNDVMYDVLKSTT